MKIAFLGLGKMGTPLVRRLLGAGHAVTVWNRTQATAEELTADGAIVAPTPTEAIQHAAILFTSLKDDLAHEDLFFGEPNLIEAIQSSQLHISLSTLSVALSKRFTEEHVNRHQLFLGSPVFGRPNVAAEGKLWIAIAGSEAAIALARPALEPLSRGITIVGQEPWQAHALKLGGNFMIASMIQTLSEAFTFAESQQIDPQLFFSTINSALFQSPFYEAYAKVMFTPLDNPGATIQLGAKDTRLFREAATSAGFDPGLAAYLATQLQLALEAGLGEADWPTSSYRTTQQQLNPTKTIR